MKGMIWTNFFVALAFIGIASWLWFKSQTPDNLYITSSTLTPTAINRLNDPDDLKQLIFSLKQAAKANAQAGQYVEKRALELASFFAFTTFLIAVGNFLVLGQLRKRVETSGDQVQPKRKVHG